MCTCGLDNCTECNPGEPEHPEGTLEAAAWQLHDAAAPWWSIVDGLRLERVVDWWIARKAGG